MNSKLQNRSDLVNKFRSSVSEVGELPICSTWMYHVIRHGVRNMDIECEHGNEPAKYSGEHIAAIVNLALEAATRLEQLERALTEISNFAAARTKEHASFGLIMRTADYALTQSDNSND